MPSVQLSSNMSLLGDEVSGMSTTSSSSLPENSTVESAFGKLECEPRKHIVVPIFYILIASVGLLANAVVICIIVILKKYQKTVTNVYVVQLAVADFLFLLILPFKAKTLFEGAWTYGQVWCKITESLRMLNYYASILFLMFMSVDRYLAINHAMNTKLSRFRSRRAVYMISVGVWTMGFLCAVFVMIYAQVSGCNCTLVFGTVDVPDYAYTGNVTGGGLDYDYITYDFNYSEEEAEGSPSEMSLKDLWETIRHAPGGCGRAGQTELNRWIICNFVLAFLLPLLVICVCYAQIIRKIYEPMTVGVKSQKSNKTRKRVTRMVTALVTVFIVCWLPYHAFHLSRINGSPLSLHVCEIIEQFTSVFAYLSSTLNPFLYTFMGTNFRKRWTSAVGRTRPFRPSIRSKSGFDYAPGRKSRRKSPAVAMTGQGKSNDEMNSQSAVTKHSIVPNNHIVRQEEDNL